MITYLVIGMLAAVYLLINLLLPLFPWNTMVKAYLIQPALWVGVIAAFRWLPGYRPLGKINKKRDFVLLGLGTAFIQVFLYAIGGLFSGFGKSPSSFTPLGIVEIVVFEATMLIGMELSRAWLITRFAKKHSFLVIILVTILFTFISIPLVQITGFKFQIGSSNQVISAWLPLLAENLVASMLVMTAGAGASLAYRGLLVAFWWLCPILPDLGWALKGLIGTVVPVLGMVVVNDFYAAQDAKSRSRKKMRSDALPTGWIFTAIACVAVVWFSTGVLPVKPALVPTGSMVPLINPGDIVLIAPVQAELIKLGDIIEYKNSKEKINIVHRVIEIGGDAGTLYFITKGDANNTPDVDPVSPQAILGKEIFIIPKVGWISIAVKNIFMGQ
jgi:signal peptidase